MKVDQIKMGATLGYIEVIIGIVLDIILTPIVVKYLGNGEFGIMNLSASLISYLSLITCGITGAYIRFNMAYRVKGDKEGEQKLNATFMLIYLVLDVIILIAGLALIFCADQMYGASNTLEEIHKIKIVLGIQIANSVVALPFTIFHVNILAYEKFIFGKVLGISNRLHSIALAQPHGGHSILWLHAIGQNGNCQGPSLGQGV